MEPHPIASAVAPKWLVSKEDIDVRQPDPTAHASTIAETAEGLVVAYWGGPNRTRLGQGLWVMRRGAQGWEAPACVAPGDPDACWNPVLHQVPQGPLLLFSKDGPNWRDWWGVQRTSMDAGRTWSRPTRLPDEILGPIRNLPRQLPSGDLLCPSSTEVGPWRVHFERTPDLGRTWSRTPSVPDPKGLEAIQPTLLVWPGGRIQALCRTRSSVVAQTVSVDGGLRWTPLQATTLANPNCSVDALVLRDGRALLVHNPTSRPARAAAGPRTPLSVSVSRAGERWTFAGDLDTGPGEFSYPCVIQTADGLVHVTYTVGIGFRGLRHVVIDPAALPDGR